MMETVKVWSITSYRTKRIKPHAGLVTCGTCGRTWDDTISTQWTPAPAGRCPFEYRRGHGHGK